MLVGHLVNEKSREVRAANAQLVLNMAATLHLDDLEPLVDAPQVMAAVVKVIQGLANSLQEEELKEMLEILVSTADKEPEFCSRAPLA